MLEGSKFHHLGVAVSSLEKAATWYGMAGCMLSEVIADPVRKVRICWVRREGDPLIELIEPDGEGSPVSPVLERIGAGPYHTCYSVPDLDGAVVELRKSGALLLGRPVAAPAISGSLVCFMFARDAGLLELVEEPAVPVGFDS